MNSALRLFVILLITSPLTINLSNAWNSGHDTTHEHIAAKLYSDMPTHIKKNLDISEMKKGANLPDKSDKDKKYLLHKYPLSVDKVEENLKKAMTYFNKAKNAQPVDKTKYYKQESLHLGMATHYISDTFAAPHTAYMENYKDYYKIADKVTKYKGNKITTKQIQS